VYQFHQTTTTQSYMSMHHPFRLRSSGVKAGITSFGFAGCDELVLVTCDNVFASVLRGLDLDELEYEWFGLCLSANVCENVM
jgi:hypothetical protein